MNPIGAALTLLVVFLVMSSSARVACLAMFGGAVYLTQMQQIEVGGLNLFAFRLIEVAGFVRVMAKGEFQFANMPKIDKVFISFLFFTTCVYLLRTREGAANRIGVSVDAFVTYFAFRGMIKNVDDFRWFLSRAVLLLAPYAVGALWESFTRHNLFTIIGGRAGAQDMMRGGRLRAFGSFRHPSLLGTLGASFLPLYIGLAFDQKHRQSGLFGIAACAGIVLASNSGGPASCALLAITGWLLWRLRFSMNWVRRGVAAVLVLLALVMKAPIWYLVARVSSVTGGDGYHRARLMDRAFNDLQEWWLAGMPLENTINWFAYYIHGNESADITNQFVSYGLTAGLGAMFLFIYVLVLALRNVGAAMRVVQSNPNLERGDEQLLWGFGVMIILHVFNWIGITYFDQTYAIWYLQLAALVSVASSILSSAPTTEATAETDSERVEWQFPRNQSHIQAPDGPRVGN